MHRVVAQQMRIGFDGAQIVDAHDDDVLAPRFHDRTQHQPTDASEPVDGDPNGHEILLLI